jgi:hypothetical protein
MPIDQQLIPDPVLDTRLERERIAARIFRSIGGLTLADALLTIQVGQQLGAMIGNAYLIAPNATSFTLSFGDPTITPIPTTPAILQAGVTALSIQSALQALPTVGAGGVAVTDNGDGSFTASFASSIPINYVLTGVGTGGAALIGITPQPNAVPQALLPELSSARPAEAGTVILTELERMESNTVDRFNQLPDKNRVGLLRLLGTTLNPAIPAQCILQFTKTSDFLNTDVLIPAGTPVSTLDLKTQVTTDADLDLPAATAAGTVSATSRILGNIGVVPANSIGVLNVSIAGIQGVTNTTALGGGRDGETVDQAKIRARELLSTGRSLGNPTDWVKYLNFNVLSLLGRVTTFEGYLSNFQPAPGLGYLLLVVQDQTGLFPAQNTLNATAALIAARHVGGVQVSATGPLFKSFNLTVSVQIGQGVGSSQLIAKATANLQALFNPLSFAYGPQLDQSGNLITRYISLSDIIGKIEAAGPNSISVKFINNQAQVVIQVGNQAFTSDVALALGELPMLGTVTLNVV